MDSPTPTLFSGRLNWRRVNSQTWQQTFRRLLRKYKVGNVDMGYRLHIPCMLLLNMTCDRGSPHNELRIDSDLLYSGTEAELGDIGPLSVAHLLEVTRIGTC